MSLSSLGLDAFYACAQIGNFTKAAEKLHITQSALSQRIQHLEDELQTTLFIRQKSGVRLTPAGERLLKYCMAKDALESEALAGIHSDAYKELSGHIRIGGFSSVMRSAVLPALAPLLTKHSGIRLQMITREMDELPVLLRRGEIDFMVMNHEFHHEGVASELLGHEQNVLCQAKGYAGGEVYLDHDENDHITERYLRLINKKVKYERHFLDDVYGLMDGVKNKAGRAVLPLHLIEGERQIEVIHGKVFDIPVWLHFYEQPFYTQLQLAVIAALKSGVKKNLE